MLEFFTFIIKSEQQSELLIEKKRQAGSRHDWKHRPGPPSDVMGHSANISDRDGHGLGCLTEQRPEPKFLHSPKHKT